MGNGQLTHTMLSTAAKDICDFEACLYDVQPSVIGGIEEEFIFSPRLDNLMMSYCSIEALIHSTEGEASLKDEKNIRFVALFDNEEIGSTSAYGANSSLVEVTMRRIQAGGSVTAFEEGIHRSYMVSADMAHAVHPNYVYVQVTCPSCMSMPCSLSPQREFLLTTARSTRRTIGPRCTGVSSSSGMLTR
jgi:aspartyl aminopeptidase